MLSSPKDSYEAFNIDTTSNRSTFSGEILGKHAKSPGKGSLTRVL